MACPKELPTIVQLQQCFLNRSFNDNMYGKCCRHISNCEKCSPMINISLQLSDCLTNFQQLTYILTCKVFFLNYLPRMPSTRKQLEKVNCTKIFKISHKGENILSLLV